MSGSSKSKRTLVGLLGFILLAGLGLSGKSVANDWWKSNMEVVGSLNLPGYASQIKKSGNRVYILSSEALGANSPTFLTILDVADPANPKILGTYQPELSASDLACSGTLVALGIRKYQGGYIERTDLIDTRDPQSPKLAGTLDTYFDAMAFSGSNLYGVRQTQPYYATGFLHVYDLSKPAAPKQLVNTNSIYGQGIAISGIWAFVLYKHQLLIVDVSNPGAPRVVNQRQMDELGTAFDSAKLAVEKTKIFAYGPFPSSSKSERFAAIDVSSGARPFLLGSYMTPGDGQELVPYGALCFIADGTKGVQVMDLSQPLDPELFRGSFFTPSSAQGIQVDGPYAYVAAGSYGLLILRYAGPGAPVTVAANPGPQKYGAAVPLTWSADPKFGGNNVKFELWQTGRKIADLGSSGSANGLPKTVSLKLPASAAVGGGYSIRAISLANPKYWSASPIFSIVAN